MMGAHTMPRRTGRAKDEQVKNPRKRSGNGFAVGAYLRTLREHKLQDNDDYHREPLVRKILAEMHGYITLSMSTIGMIEEGNTKQSSAATIDALCRAVGGDLYDISDLYRVPIPAEDDREGIKASRFEGEKRAMARIEALRSGSGIRVLAENSTPRVKKILNTVASNEQLLRLIEELADDPKAVGIVQAVLDARR